MQRFLGFLLRWTTFTALAVWVGGFTFYSAVVIPILHDEIGGFNGGLITGMVSNRLNAIGVATMILCWICVGVERQKRSTRRNQDPEAQSIIDTVRLERWGRTGRWSLLLLTSAILLSLVVLHPRLDAQLESDSLKGFYQWHQVYLILSTIQWGVNLTLLAAFMLVWQRKSF